ncbi:MAG: hypothetical protein JWQ08_2346, partial [Deinococcus sp.]|nr:hypothetical protein [Deinococcus sp.]
MRFQPCNSLFSKRKGELFLGQKLKRNKIQQDSLR